VNEAGLLMAHPHTWGADANKPCGAGPQHGAHSPCPIAGVWRIRTYQHAYCTEHAAVIVRACDRLWNGPHWGRRQTTPHGRAEIVADTPF
jgi:hypothetical protein